MRKIFIILAFIYFAASQQPQPVTVISSAIVASPFSLKNSLNYFSNSQFATYNSAFATNVISLQNQSVFFYDSNCLMTNSSILYCLSSSFGEESQSTLSAINLTSGQTTNYTLNNSYTLLTLSNENIVLGSDSSYGYFTIWNTSSNTQFCYQTSSFYDSFQNVIYQNGNVYMIPMMCLEGTCNFYTIACSNSQVTTLNMNYNTTVYGYYLNPSAFLLSNGLSTFYAMCPSTSQYNSQQNSFLIGYNCSVLSSTGTINSTIGPFQNIQQINSTNILVWTSSGQLQQYAFSFNTFTFSQVGPTLNIPSIEIVSINQLNSSQCTIMAEIFEITDFMLDLSTMTLNSTAQYGIFFQFSNGTLLIPNLVTQNGYVLFNGSTYTMVPGPSGYQSYFYSVSPLEAYSLSYSLETTGCNLTSFNLSTNNITTIPVPSCTFSGPPYDNIAAIQPYSSDDYLIAYESNGEFVFYDIATGPVGGSLDNLIIEGSDGFLNPETREFVYLQSGSKVTWSLAGTGSMVSNSSLTSTLGGIQNFVKISENLALGYASNQNETSVTFYVINPFTLAISQYISANISGVDTEYGALPGVLKFSVDGSTVEYLIYQIQSYDDNYFLVIDKYNNTYNFTGMALGIGMGSETSVSSCFGIPNLEDGLLFNCTLYQIGLTPDNNVGSGSSGSAGVIIAVVGIVVLIGAVGFYFFKRHQKRLILGQLDSSGLSTGLKA